MRAWLASPSPTPSDSKDLLYHKPVFRDTKSPFSSAKGPFELPSGGTNEMDRKLYELYGEWPGDSPGSTGQHHPVSPRLVTKTFDPLRSTLATPQPQSPARVARKGPLRSPPPSYDSQSIELHSPRRGAGSPYRHRRVPSERWGTSWAPAELDGGGYM